MRRRLNDQGMPPLAIIPRPPFEPDLGHGRLMVLGGKSPFFFALPSLACSDLCTTVHQPPSPPVRSDRMLEHGARGVEKGKWSGNTVLPELERRMGV